MCVENKATHIKTVDVPGLELLYMVYNQKKLGPESPLNDPKTRAHISAFLDRGRFADIAEGLAAPALQFSVSAIASLSNLAGAPQVMDSVLMQEYMKDKAMTIHLTVPQTLKKIAEELREQLKKVYVIVDIAVIDSEDTFEKGITDGSYETYLVGWKFELGDLEPFFTDQVHSMKGYMGHYNGGAYTNPLVDTKIEELMNVSDGKVRRQIAQDIQNVITWDDPLGIPLIETRRRIMYQQSLYFEPRLDGLVLFFEVQSL